MAKKRRKGCGGCMPLRKIMGSMPIGRAPMTGKSLRGSGKRGR